MVRGSVIEFCIVSSALLILSVLSVPEAINFEVCARVCWCSGGKIVLQPFYAH